ncbi:hypothetical protein Glove_152g120 [Diversispora epigaea]|uniref:Uncharacterized protein n=1 Tax=Diversispora epigaea TaxID=1348612 RepID=A0A397IXC9_9GLOM|nr:hypothetical protein Glove_152g120 [Diversispora epigaea]
MLMEALWSLYFRAVFLDDDIPFRSGHKHKGRKIFRGNPWSFRWAEILGVLGRQIEVLCHDWFIVEGLTSGRKIFRGNPWSFRWAEILGVLGRQIEVLCHDWFIVEGLTSWLGGWYVGTKEGVGGALLPTTALDARGAHGGSRRGSESVSIKQRFGRSQLPVTLYEE